MIPMTRDNAVAILRERIVRQQAHVEYLESRIIQLRILQTKDPWEGNASQILRLETRRVHAVLEIEALEIVLQ